MAAIDEPPHKKIKTHSSMNYFLTGQSADHIGGNKLPLFGQILPVCSIFKRIIAGYYSLEKPSI